NKIFFRRFGYLPQSEEVDRLDRFRFVGGQFGKAERARIDPELVDPTSEGVRCRARAADRHRPTRGNRMGHGGVSDFYPFRIEGQPGTVEGHRDVVPATPGEFTGV